MAIILAFCRSWSLVGAAPRSVLVNTVNKIHDALLSGPGALPPCGSLFSTFSSQIVTINTADHSSPEPKGLGRDDVEEVPKSQIFFGAARLPSQSFFFWSCRALLSYSYSPVISGSPPIQRRCYVSTAEYAGKEQQKGSRVWKEQYGRKARIIRPPFCRALSQVTKLHSEHGTKILKNKTSSGDPRKQQGDSSGRKHSRRAIRRIVQRKSSPSPTRFQFDQRLGGEVLDSSRKRKRIKPCPRDITSKRGLDADNSLLVAGDVGKKYPKQGLLPSSNAQFRQIQPARDLEAHIEENVITGFLGRRRLSEWRRGGYDPKRTAPLDDHSENKTSGSPIQQTVFKRNKLSFVAAATQAASLPPLTCPEVALAGRSNVGKSSLINALTKRWGTARTSEKPGLTQVKHYVQRRANLKLVILLLDAKWGMKLRDEELIYLMESDGVRYQIVITKTDVLCPLDLARRTTQILRKLEKQIFLVRPLMMVSSRTGAGLHLLRESLAKLAANESCVNHVHSV